LLLKAAVAFGQSDLIEVEQLDFFSDSYLELSIDEKTDERYFENWTDFTAQYKAFRVGFRYELHLPAQSYSQDTTGQGISQRFLEFRSENINMTVGNFYTILGRGLVFRAFENRVLRWDTNIDGVHLDYRHKYFDAQAMGGRPRDRLGRRTETFQALELRIKPVRQFHFGGSYLITDLPAHGDVWWGSAIVQLNHKHGTVYSEVGYKDYPGSKNDGDAIYISANLLAGALSVTAEFKNYDEFDITEGTTYNNPPTVIKEHSYSLLNRHQLVQNANDEIGYLIEAVYPVVDDGILTLNHSRTETHDDLKLYEEFYAQFEFDDRPEDVNWVWSLGRQEDLSATYWNLVNSTSWQFNDLNAIKFIYEHQQAETSLTNRQFYNHAATLSLSRSRRWTASVLGERSTDQLSDNEYWGGVQFDVSFSKKFDATVFAGSRREGKICVGGVCVVKPEFEGVEFTLVSRF